MYIRWLFFMEKPKIHSTNEHQQQFKIENSLLKSIQQQLETSKRQREKKGDGEKVAKNRNVIVQSSKEHPMNNSMGSKQ